MPPMFLKETLLQFKSLIKPHLGDGRLQYPTITSRLIMKIKTKQNCWALKNIINLRDLKDSYRQFHWNTKDNTVISPTHRTFSNWPHTLSQSSLTQDLTHTCSNCFVNQVLTFGASMIRIVMFSWWIVSWSEWSDILHLFNFEAYFILYCNIDTCLFSGLHLLGIFFYPFTLRGCLFLEVKYFSCRQQKMMNLTF